MPNSAWSAAIAWLSARTAVPSTCLSQNFASNAGHHLDATRTAARTLSCRTQTHRMGTIIFLLLTSINAQERRLRVTGAGATRATGAIALGPTKRHRNG